MNAETKQLARDMFQYVLTNARGLSGASVEQRKQLFMQAAQICIEASKAFEEVISSN
jgi:hypothetical protein